MIKTKTLQSGLKVAVNSMKGFEGVSFKMYVFTGSAFEDDPKDYGISHLIEHMFFKGTKTRTSFDIVKEFDEYGIQSNAFTSSEVTCYYTYGTGESLEKSVEIMSDMLFNSTFDENELKREKEVVVEEIKMYQDKPDAVCEMAMNSLFYDGTNYAHDIAGSEVGVRKISREQILNYIKRKYTPNNIILSFAGNVTFEKATFLAEKYFEPFFKLEKSESNNNNINQEILLKTSAKIVVKDTNQAQIMISYLSPNRFNRKALVTNNLLSFMLGGSMGSRLFQEIREKLGLVYTINSFNDVSLISGMFSISLGTSLSKVKLALKTIKNVLNEVCEKGFSLDELNHAKNSIISSLKLRSDSPSNEATNIATQLKYRNKIYSKKSQIKEYEKITLEDVNSSAKRLFTQDYCITMVGSSDKYDLIKLFK